MPKHPILQLTLCRLKEFLREPEAVFWVFGFPIMMVLALGLAFDGPSQESMIVDVVESSISQSLAESLAKDARFRVDVVSAEASENRLRTGKTELVVLTQIEEGKPVYEYQYDPTRPDSLLARNLVNDVLQRAAGREDVIVTEDSEYKEPGGRYIDFLVPGLIGMSLMGGGIWAVGFAIVDMRIRKLLKRFLATPMKKSHFLLGLMLSRLLFMIPEIAIILVFSNLVFNVTCQGSYLLLLGLIILGAAEFTGIGLLVASRAKTLEAASGLMNLLMVPMWIASGIFFSAERFPAYLQPVISVLPLTPLINAMRRVMLEGAGPAQLGAELAIIIGWTVVTFLIALRIFRWV